MSRRVIGPFNRVEGDLEVSLDVNDGIVQAAYVNSPLYRGFEHILQGKPFMDALVIVPRICGICSVSQSAASAIALRRLMQLTPPNNGKLAECLVTACENMTDHLTHFYLFFMPDFAHEDYQHRTWYTKVAERFTAVKGTAMAEVLPARASFMQLMGTMAGKWPHTLSIQPGGSSKPLQKADVLQVMNTLRNFRSFLERKVFGCDLSTFASLASFSDLLYWQQRHQGDVSLFLEAAMDLELHTSGRATDRFLSYGVYDAPEEGRLFAQGRWDDGLQPFSEQAIKEDISHAWLEGSTLPPAQGLTIPVAEKADAYSWCKAPRYDGEVYEVGALARQVVDGHPLARDLVVQHGANVLARVVGRLLELAIVIPKMEQWIRQVELGALWCHPHVPLSQGQASGLTEAARGSLGHWLSVENARISHYQIIAPTTWNFSPRDANQVPGALEQALAGVAVRENGNATPVSVQHIVRSFDPCMVCTVH